MKGKNKWHEVWLRKGGEKSSYDLEGLMQADGFDTNTGAMTVVDWLNTSGDIKKHLQISHGNNLLEIGCGAGAMLWTMRDCGANLYGVDYSETLLKKACKAIPELSVKACEAAGLTFPDNMFEAVFSHGVFFYFEDYDYAERAMNEILRVLTDHGKIFILDVPDIDKRDACETFRRDVVYAGEDYPTAEDSPYRHLYYPKSWFENFGKGNNMKTTFFDQNLPSYPMSPYRFNVLLEY